MSYPLLSALRSASVPALLVAVGLAVVSIPRDGIDLELEAIEADARRPDPRCPPETRGFRLPGPGEYPHQYMPWIRSREQFIAHLTRGEDPAVVRRYSEGPEEKLIEYLGEVFARAGRAATGPVGREAEGPFEGDLVMRISSTPPSSRLGPAE